MENIHFDSIGYKFLNDDEEIIIIAKYYSDAELVMNELNKEHNNGYKFLGEIEIYNTKQI